MSSPSTEDEGDVRKHISSFIPRPPTPPCSDHVDPDHSNPESPIASTVTHAPSPVAACCSLDAIDQLLLQQIRNAKETTFSVTPCRFQRLAPQLVELRVDYDPIREKLRRRMPSSTHESVVEALRIRLYKEKDRLATSPEVDPRVQRALERSALRGSTTVSIPRGSKAVARSPDISISEAHTDVFPTFVCEVAYSQATEDVNGLCVKYIEDTHGAIQCALAVDLPYNRLGPGSVTLYRLGDKEIDGELWGGAVEAQTVTVLNPDGDAEDAAIELQASDFLRLDPAEGGMEAERATLRIPLAEISQAFRDAREGESRPSKRKRPDAEQKRWPQVSSESEYEEEPWAKKQRRSGSVEGLDAAETGRPKVALRSRSGGAPSHVLSTIPSRKRSGTRARSPRNSKAPPSD